MDQRFFSSYTSPRVGTRSFSLAQNAFLQANDLPFQDVLTEEDIAEAFVAENACFGLESRVPADWLWLGRHVKVGDGTTLLTPDTDANQEAWPQARTQKPGLRFPILHFVEAHLLIRLDPRIADRAGSTICPNEQFPGRVTIWTAVSRVVLNLPFPVVESAEPAKQTSDAIHQLVYRLPCPTRIPA